MNVTRIAVLGVAAVAAGAAALLVRSMLGGGTPASEASTPPPVITADVLVASANVAPGRKLDVASVRWDTWPDASVVDAYITKTEQPDIAKAVEDLVVRAPLVAGQPITDANTVHSDAKGFMAATLTPGMRAISTNITAESGAGGFILPNDRVDVILTHDVSGGQNPKIWRADTILRDVRLLAIDQVSETTKTAEGETEFKVGKTATLELTPAQAELLQRAVASGNLSLTLRALGDSNGLAVASAPALGGPSKTDSMTVVRYGVAREARNITGGTK